MNERDDEIESYNSLPACAMIQNTSDWLFELKKSQPALMEAIPSFSKYQQSHRYEACEKHDLIHLSNNKGRAGVQVHMSQRIVELAPVEGTERG